MKSYIALLLVLILFTSCSTNGDSEGDTASFEFPFKVGNEWIMEIEGSQSLRVDTLLVIKDTLIGENTWYYLQANSHPGTLMNITFEGYYTTTSSGIYKYRGEADIKENIPFLITDLDEGESYINDFNSVWITTFLGNQEDQTHGTLYEYEFEFTSLMRHSRHYDFDKSYTFGRKISSNKGFLIWETGYFRSAQKDTAITLTLAERMEIRLKEFTEAE